MRLIYRTNESPASNRQPPDNAPVAGTAYFEARVYDPGETTEGAPTVSEFLATLRPGEPLRVPCGSMLEGLADAVIPAHVLRALPADAKLVLAWHWQRAEG